MLFVAGNVLANIPALHGLGISIARVGYEIDEEYQTGLGEALVLFEKHGKRHLIFGIPGQCAPDRVDQQLLSSAAI